ncbi:MAG: sodium:solute symporter family protein [bacterium]
MIDVSLGWMDYSIMLIYVAAVLGIGQALRKYMKSSNDFFLSGRSIPAWVTGLAFISANLGALELVGMAASGAKYGMMTCHFYWIGAILAMTFLAVFMMPFYYGSKARSVPEYLNMRFDGRVRCLNSISFAVMTVFASGISMNALAKLLHSLLGWNYHVSLWVCSGVVLLYVLKGGLTSAIYTEVLQFFMIVLGFFPVVYLGLKDVGGWSALKEKLAGVAMNPASIGVGEKSFQPDAWTGAWSPMLRGAEASPMGVDLFAMVFGLGFVLAFGYWCTDFLVVQRAMAAKNMSAARRTPLIGAIPKMLIPALVILPGMIAAGLAFSGKDGYRLPPKMIAESAYEKILPVVKNAATSGLKGEAAVQQIAKASGVKMLPAKVDELLKVVPTLNDTELKSRVQNAVAENDYDGVILSLIKRYCPTGLLGLALTALLASFMSGMAGNVTAFNTVWTYDLYQAYIAPKRADAHYMWMGRAATVAGILISVLCAYFAAMYNNAMDVIQLVFGFVNAPLFATFLLGMFWKRTTATGAFLGLLLGTMTSMAFHAMTLATGNAPGVKGGYLFVVRSFPSEMAQNFWLASFAFLACLSFTVVISLATKRTKTDAELTGLVYSLTPRIQSANEPWHLRPGVIAVILLVACLGLNIIFF